MEDFPVVLTVRGTHIPKTVDAARVLHNETAGSQPGIAAARALGDLSHKVYVPCLRSPQVGSAKDGELLFLDNWTSAKGLMEFFANAHVQEQAGKMFSQRDPGVWMAARGAFTYHLLVPANKTARFVGIIRGQIAQPEKSIEIFARAVQGAQRDARRRGHLSHDLYIKLSQPGEPMELLGIDQWCDFDGMTEHYSDKTHMSAFGGSFSGRPDTTVWEQAPGEWSEW